MLIGVSNEEIFDAVKHMNPLKAFGPDGIQVISKLKAGIS